jgi:hypothetical protein
MLDGHAGDAEATRIIEKALRRATRRRRDIVSGAARSHGNSGKLTTLSSQEACNAFPHGCCNHDNSWCFPAFAADEYYIALSSEKARCQLLQVPPQTIAFTLLADGKVFFEKEAAEDAMASLQNASG